MNELSKDSFLQHYGILGMRWGVRRYQPYSQGYDAEHKGRFIGKQQKSNAKIIKKAAKRGGIERVMNTDVVKSYLKSDEYSSKKRAATESQKRSIDAESEYYNTIDKILAEEIKKNPTADSYDVDYSSHPELRAIEKELDRLSDERAKSYTEFNRLIERYTDEILGKYGDTKVSGMNIPYGKTEIKTILRTAMFKASPV